MNEQLNATQLLTLLSKDLSYTPTVRAAAKQAIKELKTLREKLAESEQETISRLRAEYVDKDHVAGCQAFLHLQSLLKEQ